MMAVAASVVLAGMTACAFGDEDAVLSLLQSEETLLYVAVGRSGLYVLENGALWSPNLISLSGMAYGDAAYGNGRFVSIWGDAADNYLALSGDGIIWLGPTYISEWGGNTPSFVSYYNGRFFIEINQIIHASEDGLVWYPVSPVSQNIKIMAAGTSRVVAIGQDGPYTKSYTSLDGIVWLGPFDVPMTLNPLTPSTMAYGNGLFILTGQGQVAVSLDGIVWSLVSVPDAGFNDLSAIAYGNGRFVMSDGQYWYVSPNGLVWAKTASTDSYTFYDTVYCGGRFVAVGWNGSDADSMVSSDGIFWQRYSMPASDQVMSITCRPGTKRY